MNCNAFYVDPSDRIKSPQDLDIYGCQELAIAVAKLDREGFRRMTWGRTLWLVVLLKLVILFGVLRVFFFKPAMAGLNDQQRSEQVFQNLTTK